MAEHMDLRALSLQLEDDTGGDSIPTIERMYNDGTGRHRCVFPGCDFKRNDAIKMWKHVHFSRKHGLSFGMSLEHLVAERLRKEGLPKRSQA